MAARKKRGSKAKKAAGKVGVSRRMKARKPKAKATKRARGGYRGK